MLKQADREWLQAATHVRDNEPDPRKQVYTQSRIDEYCDQRGIDPADVDLPIRLNRYQWDEAVSYDQRAERIAALLAELLQDHERRQHGGERCPRETINVLAFLAHKIGVLDIGDEEAVRQLATHIRDYQAVHEEHRVHEDAGE